MKKNALTIYLAVFLLVCIVLDGVLLCFFADKPWWNNWMVTAPNLFMVLGAFYCHLMKKNVDEHPDKLTWLYIYKGIKILLTVAMVVLYIFLVKVGSKAFIIITASAYLIGLVVETFVYIHYTKHKNKESKA
jgi:hypothetical protein